MHNGFVLYKRKEGDILLPLFTERIHAGFESPATDYQEERIDSNSYVTKYPEATFYGKVYGDCMTGSGMWKELKGESCIPMEYIREAKKGIGTSRSFGKPEMDLTVMLEAVATYTSIAALKLRNQNSVSGKVEVYTHTSRFVADPSKYFSAAMELKLPTPTSSTAELIKVAKFLLKKIFKPGYRYQKVGVMLTDIRPDNQVQQSLFDKNSETRSKMAVALDEAGLPFQEIHHQYKRSDNCSRKIIYL